MRLEVTKSAENDLADLDKKTQRRVKTALDRLLSCPQAADLKKLKGSQDTWRMRLSRCPELFRSIWLLNRRNGNGKAKLLLI
ncbi:MAG: hypothetical protein DDT21_02074 [Syntrophomonadaceae bacterium]|nr:hypothetical protein [Bacillota bacterium]